MWQYVWDLCNQLVGGFGCIGIVFDVYYVYGWFLVVECVQVLVVIFQLFVCIEDEILVGIGSLQCGVVCG